MMMKIFLLLVSCLTRSEAFSSINSNLLKSLSNNVLLLRAQQQKKSSFINKKTDKDEEKILSRIYQEWIYQEWKEEAAHMDAIEHSVESDADLMGIFEQKKKKKPLYMEQEFHRHDSLLNEIEHSIDNDSYLYQIAAKKSEAQIINKEYITNESHRHDSLLDEIAHSIDNDSYLIATASKEEEDELFSLYGKWQNELTHIVAMEHAAESDADLMNVFEQKHQQKKYYMERESHCHDSLLREIEHSIDTDPDLHYIVSGASSSAETQAINQEYIHNEAHRHDSLLDEIAHSIDSDPYYL